MPKNEARRPRWWIIFLIVVAFAFTIWWLWLFLGNTDNAEILLRISSFDSALGSLLSDAYLESVDEGPDDLGEPAFVLIVGPSTDQYLVSSNDLEAGYYSWFSQNAEFDQNVVAKLLDQGGEELVSFDLSPYLRKGDIVIVWISDLDEQPLFAAQYDPATHFSVLILHSDGSFEPPIS